MVFVTFYSNAQLINSVSYKGNKKTKSEVLNKLISAKVGTVLDSVILKSDVVLLSRLPVSNRSTYKVDKNIDGSFDVVYEIEETNTIIPALNFWTASNEQFSYQLGIKEFNFLGENKEIGAFYRNNGFDSFSINYTDPFLFNKTTGISLTLQSLTSLEPLNFEGGISKFKYTNSSIEAAVKKILTPSHKIEIGINFFKEKYSFFDGFKSDEIPEDLTQYKLLFKGGFDYNRLIFDYQYVEGFRSYLSAQFVMPTSREQDDFFIVWNDFFYYKRVKEKGNFASRLRIGISSNDDGPFAPFALDNNLNVRGVGNIIDRGTAVFVTNTEYRYTLIDKDWFSLQTNVFLDAGTWRFSGGELNDLFKIKSTRIHPGVGLRFIHKKIFNAVLRIDYGRGVVNGKQKGLVFGVGQYF